MTFWINRHGVDKRKHLPAKCGTNIGKGLIKDLLNYTINTHGASSFTPHPYARIEFHINKLHFIPDFVPEDLSGMAFTAFKPTAPAAPPAATVNPYPSPPAAGPTPITPYNPMANFNVASLPLDVLARYNLNKAANSVMTAADMRPFVDTSGTTPRTYLYHQANPQVFVTRSSSMFIFPSTATGYDNTTPDRFKKTAPKCNAWVPNCI